MKLHQLRYLAAVAQNGLNITAAAQKLHTSQPGVSKQLKLLEDELGFQIFARDGRNLTQITPAGEQVIERALRILREVHSIKSLSEELRDEVEPQFCPRQHSHDHGANGDGRIERAAGDMSDRERTGEDGEPDGKSEVGVPSSGLGRGHVEHDVGEREGEEKF